MSDVKVSNVPPKDDGPSFEWGEAPPGTPHAPVALGYALCHQVMCARFDWARRAVVGSTDLRVAAVGRPLDRVDLDAVGMAVRGVRVAGTELPHRYDGRTLSVALPAPLAPGAEAELTVDYEAVRPKAGVYFVDGRRVVWAQGKLEDTRFWVPTDDRPDAKPTWEFLVRSGAGERAFATGELAGSRPTDGGDTEWRWVAARPTPPALVAVAVGPYATADDKAAGVAVRYWAEPDSLAKATPRFSTAPRAIAYMREKLGTPFPAPSLDLAVVPNYVFWDWLESWRPWVTAPVLDEQMIVGGREGWRGETAEVAVARVVAQQWFGRLVTPRDWSHVWLNEGFANFLALSEYEAAHGREAAAPLWSWAQTGAFAADVHDRRPVVSDRWVYGPMELLLTEHAGMRGATVLRMLRHSLGDAAFWGGVHRFLADHADGTATTADLERALEAASGRDLATFFQQWVYGAGFPALRVAFAYDSASRRLTFRVRQVQARDSLTGFFDADVDAEVETAAGVVRAVVPLHGELTEFAVALPAPPRAVRWDPDGLLLCEKRVDVPTEMLVYQLQHGKDAASKGEAAQALTLRARGMEGGGVSTFGFTDDNVPPLAAPDAMAAVLSAARSDSSPAARAQVIHSMMGAFDPESEATLLKATHDADPAVRGSAAMALFGPPTPARLARLREMSGSDPDAEVRQAAAQMLGMMDRMGELAGAGAPPAEENPDTMSEEAVLDRLGASRVSGQWAFARRVLQSPRSSRHVRQAAMRSLGVAVFMGQFRPDASAGELVTLLAPFLDSDDPSTRLAAVREFGAAKIPAAVAALEARKKVEADVRVLDAIDASLREIARKDEFPPR